MAGKRRSRKKKATKVVQELFVDLNRESSVGISFLKLGLSNALYHAFPSYNEGQLSAKWGEDIKYVRQKLESYSKGDRHYSYAFVGCMVITCGVNTTFTFVENLIAINVKLLLLNTFFYNKLQDIRLTYQEKEFQKLEQKIGYTFQNRALLLQAFTNDSHELANIIGTYQRLEFLGDAVLEYLVVRYLYDHPSEFDRGQIAQYRGIYTSNETLAVLTVKYGLKNYVLYGPNSTFGGKDFADIFESLVAAIFIDSGMNLDTVLNIVLKMYRKIKCFRKLDSKV